MERRPFEIVAECEMAGFPSGADADRVRERIAEAQRSWPAIVRAAVNPPAVFKDRRYVLQARFVVWAEDGRAATQAVEGLLAGAGVQCRTVLPSGRALTEAEIPPPVEKAGGPARAAGPASPARAAAGPAARTAAGPPRTAKRAAGARVAKRAAGARAARPTRATRARAGGKTHAGGRARAGGEPRASSKGRGVRATRPVKGRTGKTRRGRTAGSR